ncbi:MAG: acyltransferase [Burkholderiales bacterium]|nr:acyltransferase [Burkholderiales bacterium]
MTEVDSIAIKVCRVLCIFFMSYVHVNPGHDFWPTGVPDHLSVLGFVLADLLGRASVPALSVLSGYLAVAAYDRRRNWWAYAKDRWLIMIVPMIVWNALIIALSAIILWWSGVPTAVIHHLGAIQELTPLRIADRLTGYQYGAATSALNFLRDLFFCSLLLPVLRWCTHRLDVGAVGLVWLLGMTVGFSPVVMRPSILMFFSIGVYLVSRNRQLVPSLGTVARLFTTLMLVFAGAYFVPFLQSHENKELRDTAFRLLMASLFLIATLWLSRMPLGKLIARLEPMIYMMYLSHVVVLLLLWGAWQQVFEKDLEWPYAVFFVGAPVATVLIVQAAQKGLLRLPSALQRLLVGKAAS